MQTKELSCSVAGRPLPILVSATNVHELDQNDDSTIELTLFNADSTQRFCDLAYNGYGVRIQIPAESHVQVGPFMIAGRASDGTQVANKHLILTAEVGSSMIQVMGRVS